MFKKFWYLFLIFICSLSFVSPSVAELPGSTLNELGSLGTITDTTILYGVNTPDATPDGGKIPATVLKTYFSPSGEALAEVLANDGSGSTLDADAIDGIDSAALVKNTGDESIAGVKSFTSFPVTPSALPTTDYQVVNKAYVTSVTTSPSTAIDSSPDDTEYISEQGIFEYIDVYNVISYGADGSDASEDTTYISNAITAANAAGDANNRGTVFLPQGIYYVTAGELTEIDCNIYGPNAQIRAFDDTDAALITIDYQHAKGRYFNLKWIQGYSQVIGGTTYSVFTTDPGTGGPGGGEINYYGTGLYIKTAWFSDFKVQMVAGFDECVYLHMTDSSGVHGNTFWFNTIGYGEDGLRLFVDNWDDGIADPNSFRIESNYIYCNYMVLCRSQYVQFYDAGGSSRIQDNQLEFQDIEQNADDSNSVAFFLSGTNIFGNTIEVKNKIIRPGGGSGTPITVYTRTAHHNTFILPEVNWAYIDQSSEINFFDAEWGAQASSRAGSMTGRYARTSMVREVAPTDASAYFQKGDICWNNFESTTTNFAWICTVAGQGNACTWTGIPVAGGGGGGSGTMTTVKESGVQKGGADIVTLDFQAGVDISIVGTEANISLDLTEVHVMDLKESNAYKTSGGPISIIDFGAGFDTIITGNVEADISLDLTEYDSGAVFQGAQIDYMTVYSGAVQGGYIATTATVTGQGGRLIFTNYGMLLQGYSGGWVSAIQIAAAADANNPLRVMVSGVLHNVTEGASDSGGAGYKVLRVPN